jgi:hypothetical protein
VIAGDSEHFVAAVPQPFEELARLLELLGPCALREIAADHDEVGLELIHRPIDALDQPLVMSAEMEVGKMDEASHRLA